MDHKLFRDEYAQFAIGLSSVSWGGRNRIWLTVRALTCLMVLGQHLPRTKAEEANPGNFESQVARERVKEGKVDVANAAWWGFDSRDATAAIQSAIDSRARKIMVPYMGREWVVRPLTLRSGKEIILEPGVVISAKEGDFHGLRDCLISGANVQDVSITGYGAILRMRRDDYVTSRYEKSEWRHGVALWGAENVRIRGITVESSGGDGIYIGSTPDEDRVPCRDITVRDCTSRRNYRQGMSVISVKKLRVEHCRFEETRGTSPQAGLDLEPDHFTETLSDVVIVGCIASDNEGCGYVVNLSRLNRRSPDVSIRFEKCLVRKSYQPGLRVMHDPKSAPRGRIEFIDCIVEDVYYPGLYCKWDTTLPLQLRFINCKWRNTARKKTEVPLHFDLAGRNVLGGGGGIEFINCYVYDDREREAVRIGDLSGGIVRHKVSGEIHVINRWLEEDTSWPRGLTDLKVRHYDRQR